MEEMKKAFYQDLHCNVNKTYVRASNKNKYNGKYFCEKNINQSLFSLSLVYFQTKRHKTYYSKSMTLMVLI